MTAVIDRAMAIADREVRQAAMAVQAPPRPMARRHFRCDDCGTWCECTGDARLLPHTRCGIAAERS